MGVEKEGKKPEGSHPGSSPEVMAMKEIKKYTNIVALSVLSLLVMSLLCSCGGEKDPKRKTELRAELSKLLIKYDLECLHQKNELCKEAGKEEGCNTKLPEVRRFSWTLDPNNQELAGIGSEVKFLRKELHGALAPFIWPGGEICPVPSRSEILERRREFPGFAGDR